MPNWCDNVVKISHADATMIDRAEKAFNERQFLNEFIPVPEELYDTVAGGVPEGYARELHDAQKALNIKYFGCQDWYDYCIKHWGVKWDVGGDEAFIERDDEHHLSLNFDSAWGPPIAAYEKLEELGFHISAYYYEPGCGFCGQFINGTDEAFDLINDSEWVNENIPREINEAFAIAETMALDEAEA